MTSIRTAYERVNATWPKEVPPMTAGEAIRAASRLYRWALGTTFVGTIQETSGNRVNGIRWLQGGGTQRERVLYVNPERGWKDLVHHLSHDFYWAVNGYADRPHNKDHARVERNMIKEVLKRGWLDGRLKDEPKPEPTKGDLRLDKLARIDARIQTWETKGKRVASALKRLHASRKALLRAIDKAEAA